MPQEFEEFFEIIASNDWSDLEPENRPDFIKMDVQPIDELTIIPIGYIPYFGSIEIVIKKDGFNG